MGEIMDQDQYNKDLSMAYVGRRNQYPSIADQLDMIWNDMDTNKLEGKGSTLYNAVKAIKDQFPKPVEGS
jgi:hypothetical protein